MIQTTQDNHTSETNNLQVNSEMESHTESETEQQPELQTGAEGSRFSKELEKDLVKVFKLLADETRLRILMFLLNHDELHVSALCEKLSQSQPAVSHHLALLRDAKMLEARRDGKHNFYSLCKDRFHQVMKALFDGITQSHEDSIRFDGFVLSHQEEG